MKIIDRYILREFILPFFYCILTLFLLYLIADLFEHMDEFLKSHVPWLDILRYYLFMLPNIYIEICPFSLVLALIYLLGNFTRHHEIIGMRAAGISSKRIAVPFLLLGWVLSALFFYLNEEVIPQTRLQSEIFKKIFSEKETDENSQRYEDLTYGNALENYALFIHKLDPKTNIAQDVQVHYLNPDGTMNKLIRAQTGRWLDNEWWFFNGTIVRYSETGDITHDPEVFYKRKTRIYESPLDLIREEKASEQMNYSELKNSLSKKYGGRIPASQRVELYEKLATPWICFILVLVVVPIGLTITRGGALPVLGKTILLTLTYYGLQFTLSALGKQGYLPPLLASWLANGIFGGLGMILMMRLK
ncbi:MAG: LptF/LptG family permease [Chlamydiae bacterium]|nr:LptF/LptG family permease [Chlamydiota bacterium]MBI3267317.1 LptF/LptG family permease [Chlamydiota bacterium]